MPRKVVFYDVTRRLLEERLKTLKQGEKPSWTDMRHLFYECRNKYLRENPDRLEIDSKSKDPYADWETIIKVWCKKRCETFGIPTELWWRLREKVNIWPEGRATCEGESGRFLIDNETRGRVSERCSFVLFCEKRTVRKELLEKLGEERYRLNIVATSGHSPTDVQEAVIQIGEGLDDDPNFYCLILHDYDLDGVKIMFNLKERYRGVIDIGVNSAFIHYLITRGGFDRRLVEEQVLNKNHQGELREKMIRSQDYTLEDFDYLQGQQISEKRWQGKRIEIDAIHVEYGIQPFIDYIMEKIKTECRVWDLSRIGVEEHWLEEPKNHYKKSLSKLGDDARSAYEKKLAIGSRDNIFNRVIRVLLEVDEELLEVIRKHWVYAYNPEQIYTTWRLPRSLSLDHLSTDELSELKTDYSDQMKREWLPDYEDELDEINKQVTRYEGDVREGEEDLESQRDDLQERLEKDKKKDPDLDGFTERLDEVEWGEEELEDIEVPDEADEIKKVIEALESRLEEMEEASSSSENSS